MIALGAEPAVCAKCSLHTSALTVCVQGRGSMTAPVLVVGQNPGAQEDLAGEAFVGPSGKLLVAMLTDAGYVDGDYRLTNAVRCATERNSTPMPSSVDACRDHLVAEILDVRPQVIIALGDTALRSLCKIAGLKEKRGKSFPLHPSFGYECEVWPTYHPAFVLRLPQARNTVVADMRRVRDRTKEQTVVDWARFPWTSITEPGPLALDIETIDKEGNIVEQPTQIAFAGGRDLVSVCDPALLKSIHGEPPIQGNPIVTHNGWAFDLPKLRAAGVDVPRWGRDTLVLAYLDDETQPLGLESLAVKYLGVRGWKEDRDSPLGSDKLAEYNARDAQYTLELYEKLIKALGQRVRIADKIILPARVALNACTQRGIFIDAARVAAEKVKQEEAVARSHAAVLAEVEDSGIDLTARFGRTFKNGTVKTPPFNPNSTAHVAAVLDHLGFYLPQTGTGKDRTDKETLSRVEHPFVDALQEHRAATKRLSTYILPYEAAASSPDGRVHPHYTCYKTVTGRTSASGPNVQNLDRDLKAFFSAPPPAVFVVADYAAIEFRIAAWLAGEQTIIKHYQRNSWWDAHTWFACRLYDKTEAEVRADHKADPANSMRQIAKSANFSQLYMGNGETLRNYAAREMGMQIPNEQAHKAHKAWHAAFPGFGHWYQRTFDFLMANGYVYSVTGRRRHFGDVSLMNRYALSEALREAVNFQAQSFATADIALLGLISCWQARLPVNYFCHDSVGFEFADIDTAKAAAPLIRRCMIDEPVRRLRESFSVDLTIPLEIEIEYPKNGEAA